MGLSRASKNLLMRKSKDERLKKMGYDPNKFRILKKQREISSRFKAMKSASKGLMSDYEYRLRLRNLKKRNK